MNDTIEWNTRTADLAYTEVVVCWCYEDSCERRTADLTDTEVRYKTNSGGTNTVKISPAERYLTCPDIKPGELFEYRSVFLPPKGIDFITREWLTSSKPFLYFYPRAAWTAEAKNGNHNWNDGGGGSPALVFDGRDNPSKPHHRHGLAEATVAVFIPMPIRSLPLS